MMASQAPTVDQRVSHRWPESSALRIVRQAVTQDGETESEPALPGRAEGQGCGRWRNAAINLGQSGDGPTGGHRRTHVSGPDDFLSQPLLSA